MSTGRPPPAVRHESPVTAWIGSTGRDRASRACPGQLDVHRALVARAVLRKLDIGILRESRGGKAIGELARGANSVRQ